MNEKRTKALADFIQNKDLATLGHFLDIQDKLDEQSENDANDKQEIIDAINSIEMPEAKDESENFKAIMDKLDEPQDIEVTLNIV